MEDLTTTKLHSEITRPLVPHFLLELKTKVYFYKLIIVRLSLFHIWSKNEYICVDIETFSSLAGVAEAGVQGLQFFRPSATPEMWTAEKLFHISINIFYDHNL